MDINCDLGEGESLVRTRALMRRVTSANIACGGHAGDADSMRACLRLCRELGVHAGAHPGFEDRENFGRVAHPLKAKDLKALLTRQIEALRAMAKKEGVPLAHIKLHGALYHAVEKSPALAAAFVEWVKKKMRGCRIIALAGGRVLREARKQRVPAWGELFAERGYRVDGALIPRDEPGALLSDLKVIRVRTRSWAKQAEGETVCVHSDSPGAVKIAQILADVLRA